MNYKYKVSVILPNYNHSKFLKQRIDSILNQTFQDFELIILDDKSPDNSTEVIETYRGHEKITHIVINEHNSGSTFIQWDRGFSLAQGKYVWIAESDDYADLTLLEKCVSALEKNEKAVLCYSDSNFVDENSKLCKHWISKLIIDDKSRAIDGVVIYKGADYVKDYMLFKNYLYNASMIVFRHDAINSISPYYKTFKGCGDWVFWGEMIMQQELIHIPEPLNNFRQHSNKVSNAMKNSYEHFLDDACVYTYLLKLYSSYMQNRGLATPEELLMIKRNTSKYIGNVISSYVRQKRSSSFIYSIKLFNFIPLYCIKYKPNYEKHYLLGFIPLFVGYKEY